MQRDGYGDDWDTGSSNTRPRYDKPATDSSLEWEGWGTALKPANEPIVVARKPLSEKTIAANVLKWGTGALNIDGCRVEGQAQPFGNGTARSAGIMGESEPPAVLGKVKRQRPRMPANIIHDGSEEVLDLFPETLGQRAAVGPANGAKSSVNVYGDYGPRNQFEPRGDKGSAARFFYCAKANKNDRLGSKHPTVKPVKLISYLCRLVTPPNGVVLDPFAGTGTLASACHQENFGCVLVEREDEYVADIKRRISSLEGTAEPQPRPPVSLSDEAATTIGEAA